MKKRLFVDLEKCYECKECSAKCSYFYHPKNKGIISLLELVARTLVCRNCEVAPCVKACPNEALEEQQDGTLKRYSMRCTGCNTCAFACPFGTIYPEILPYISSQCDYCVDQVDKKEPECVNSCPKDAVKFFEVEEQKEKDIYFIGENLAIHSVPWRKK